MNSCKYFDAGWCYAPDDVETSASSQSACFDPDYCPYLKSQMTEIEKTEGEIKVLQAKLELLKEMEKHKTPCEIAYRDWWGEYPTTTWRNDIDRWNAFEKGYNASKVTEVEPSMTNCVLLGNPPDGYVTWNEWYNEMGSKGILHNLKISSKDYKPTPQTPEQVNTFAPKELEELVREGMKWCEEHPDESVEDYLTPQDPPDAL